MSQQTKFTYVFPEPHDQQQMLARFAEKIKSGQHFLLTCMELDIDADTGLDMLHMLEELLKRKHTGKSLTPPLEIHP